MDKAVILQGPVFQTSDVFPAALERLPHAWGGLRLNMPFAVLYYTELRLNTTFAVLYSTVLWLNVSI